MQLNRCAMTVVTSFVCLHITMMLLAFAFAALIRLRFELADLLCILISSTK